MLPEQYNDFDADELSDEIKNTDELIQVWQNTVASTRKKLNRAMDLREDLLDRQKFLLQQRGWKV